MKIYISGKITGLPTREAYENFQEAELFLTKLGHQVFNPMRIPQDPARSWQSYMDECLKELPGCDAIFMLGSWHDSKGAQEELRQAIRYDMIIYYEEVIRQRNPFAMTIKNRIKLFMP